MPQFKQNSKVQVLTYNESEVKLSRILAHIKYKEYLLILAKKTLLIDTDFIYPEGKVMIVAYKVVFLENIKINVSGRDAINYHCKPDKQKKSDQQLRQYMEREDSLYQELYVNDDNQQIYSPKAQDGKWKQSAFLENTAAVLSFACGIGGAIFGSILSPYYYFGVLVTGLYGAYLKCYSNPFKKGGSDGYAGEHGENGSDGGCFILDAMEIDGLQTNVKIIADGGNGGDGQDGGDGASCSNNYCVAPIYRSGGDGGNGGNAGQGGRPGYIKIIINKETKHYPLNTQSLSGKNGSIGKGGKGGAGWDWYYCKPCVQGGKNGEDGTDGAECIIYSKKPSVCDNDIESMMLDVLGEQYKKQIFDFNNCLI